VVPVGLSAAKILLIWHSIPLVTTAYSAYHWDVVLDIL
jgi:hypothetical protein